MALNKRKVLDAARKFAQKGAKAKALKEYQKLLQADPRDAKLLLEVGDAYRRWGQAEEAIAQYGKVAQQYRQDGFDARAVAVFKQILNLDPKHYAAYVSLAELYQRMGLDAEAIAALQTAADGYHKEGRKTDALELLRQMAALDPTNTTSRLKVAELLRQEGMTQEALVEYQAVADELANQQDRDQLVTVLERVLEIKPDHLPSLTSLVRQLVAAGDFARAEPLAVRALNASADPERYELLIDLYARAGADEKLADATRGLAKLYRERGDEEKARELVQRLPVPEVGSGSRLAVDVSEIDDPDVSEHELLADEPFLALDDEAAVGAGTGPTLDAEDEVELMLEASDEIALEPEPSPPVAEEALPEGDPEQLLAEANVYLRYGKAQQAIASLRGVLAQVPDHRHALEKLGEAYADTGQAEQAVDAWCRAAEQVRLQGDAQALTVLKDRIAALDPAAASTIGPIASTPAPAGPAREAGLEAQAPELDLDVELDLDDAAEGDGFAEPGIELPGLDFELELDGAGELRPEDASTGGASAEWADETVEAAEDGDGLDASFEFELDLDADSEAFGEEAEDASEDGSIEFELDGLALDEDGDDEPESAGNESQTARIAEELEEAEFYIAQDMFDEAEGVLRRVLELAPNHPSAMLRLGEIAAARGTAPDAVVDPLPLGTAETTTGGFELSDRFDEEDETLTASPDELDDDSDPALTLADDDDSDPALTLSDDDEGGIEFEVDLDEDPEEAFQTELAHEEPGHADSIRLPDSNAADVAPDDSDASASAWDSATAELTSPNGGQEGETSGGPGVLHAAAGTHDPQGTAAPTGAVADPTAMDAGETFDLREALADVFAGDADRPTREAPTTGVLSTVEDGFESIFSDFKKGVSATLEEGDYDTRYDLGIAYREMGLFEDAIAEFRVCLDSSARRFDSLYLMGLCARDLGRFDDAVNHLEQALALPELPEDRMAGVYFDLSIAQEGAGDLARAHAMIDRVLALEPEFPGAAARKAALAKGRSEALPDLAEPGEEFESFDELFDDDASDTKPVAAGETFESFDDVLSEAEAVLGRDDDGDPGATGDGETSRRGGRKKISFV